VESRGDLDIGPTQHPSHPLVDARPRDFEMFAKADPNVHGALLILNSDGGSVLGTLALGRAPFETLA
jgi:hypothetical protein